MKKHLNTLFVTLEGAYLRKDGAAVEVRRKQTPGAAAQSGWHRMFRLGCFVFCLAHGSMRGSEGFTLVSYASREIPGSIQWFYLRQHPFAPGAVSACGSRTRRSGHRCQHDRRQAGKHPPRPDAGGAGSWREVRGACLCANPGRGFLRGADRIGRAGHFAGFAARDRG